MGQVNVIVVATPIGGGRQSLEIIPVDKICHIEAKVSQSGGVIEVSASLVNEFSVDLSTPQTISSFLSQLRDAMAVTEAGQKVLDETLRGEVK